MNYRYLIIGVNMFLMSCDMLANIVDLPEKLICVIVPSYNNILWWQWNINSILRQDYTNVRIVITDDNSNDGTGEALAAYIEGHHLENKVQLLRNKERRGALYNWYTMIHCCPDEAIIVTVDGDDALPEDPYLLKKINAIYSSSQKEVWLTYGQFQLYPERTRGWCCAIPEGIIKRNEFRKFPDLPSHLRTFYAWLFKAIELEDLMYQGDFFTMSGDCAIMFPMIEMAGERHQFINNITYLYNTQNQISDHRKSRELQASLDKYIRSLERYDRLEKKLVQ